DRSLDLLSLSLESLEAALIEEGCGVDRPVVLALLADPDLEGRDAFQSLFLVGIIELIPAFEGIELGHAGVCGIGLAEGLEGRGVGQLARRFGGSVGGVSRDAWRRFPTCLFLTYFGTIRRGNARERRLKTSLRRLETSRETPATVSGVKPLETVRRRLVTSRETLPRSAPRPRPAPHPQGRPSSIPSRSGPWSLPTPSYRQFDKYGC